MSRRRQHSTDWRSGHALGRVLPGYGERHVRTVWFGTGETRLASLVSKDRSYKPMVKSSGGKRESDGVVVPMIAGRNPAGGKDPDFGHAGDRGTSEGMAGTARPSFPEGHLAPVKVRRLQNRLWAAAKQSKGRAFHALYDRIYRRRHSRGRRGSGSEPIVGQRGSIKSPSLRWRPMGSSACSPSSRDASVQATTTRHQCAGWRFQSPTGRSGRWASRLSRTVCASRRPSSSSNPSSRPTSCPVVWVPPKRSATDAMERLRVGFIEGNHFVFEADIENFFGQIDHERLLGLVGRAGVGPAGAQAASTVAAGRGVGQWGRHRVGHGDAPGRGDLTPLGQHLPARFRSGLGRARHRRSRPLCGRLRGAVLDPRSRPKKPSGGQPPSWVTSVFAFIWTRPEWSTSGRARKASTSSDAIFVPACPASSGSRSGSSATTSTAGRRCGP